MFALRVMLEYFHPWPNSAGFYLARERGWYREAGLDVELVVHDPYHGDTLDHLARGAAALGVFPSNRLLVRRELGQPLIGVAAINHRGLESIQTLTDSGIRRPRDLQGKRLALNPTPRGIAMVRHLVSRDGGDPDAVELVDAGFRELRPEDLAAGHADASFGGYWAWEALLPSPIADERRVVLPVDEIGAPPYHSYLLGAREDWLEAHGDIARRFLAITARGFLAAAAEPEAALPVYERTIPYFPREMLAASLRRIAPSWLHEGHWGEQREDLLRPYAQWLHEYGVLRDPEVWRGATSNAWQVENPA
ncbi:ABC transporter substrate-binding protein [Metapseudomonas otitidis]|uniref:ABC transporter substrate-binding protein n=1 Tax=Metapseudomonas otitidis TaxID=319939 RepID=UPI00227C5B7C|nr:ABC transporter substrate-binding protein [Pseudomonas otitidis]WAF83272.1 ABC transporter substrate-binding protein [Pseudomonas otitidis]